MYVWGSGSARNLEVFRRILMIVAASLAFSSAHAADRIRVAAQKTGTFAWELEVLKAHGLDRQAGVDIATTELATTEAGKIALESGSVDLMLSDWLWVARERALGGDGFAIEGAVAAGDLQANVIVACDDGFEREPP